MEAGRHKHPDQSRLALAVLVFGAVVLAAAPILVRLAACGPAAAAFWRLAIATPFLALIASRQPAGLAAPSRAMVLAGVAFALDLGFWHYGIRLTSVANATVLSNLTPVLVTLASWLFLAERPRPQFLVGMALAMAGAVLMAEAAAPREAGVHPHLGDVVSVLTAVWYALYFLAVRVARERHRAARVILWTGLVAAPLLLFGALAMHETILPATSLGWAAVIALGVIHVLGQGSITWSLGRLPASTASVTVLVQPVVAALLAYQIFGESLTPWQAAGGAVALAGVVAAQQSPARRTFRPRRPAPAE